MRNAPRLFAACIALAIAACAALYAAPALAWGGVFVAGPSFVIGPPPVAYPPPPYYYPPPPPPPPVAYVPQESYGGTCYAGVYVCAAPAQTPVGAGCSCPGLGAPSYGSVQ